MYCWADCLISRWSLIFASRKLDNQTSIFLDCQPTKQTDGWISLFPTGQPNNHSPTLPTSWMSSCPANCEEEGSILFTVVYKSEIGGFFIGKQALPRKELMFFIQIETFLSVNESGRFCLRVFTNQRTSRRKIHQKLF